MYAAEGWAQLTTLLHYIFQFSGPDVQSPEHRDQLGKITLFHVFRRHSTEKNVEYLPVFTPRGWYCPYSPLGCGYWYCGDQKTRNNANMWSFARWMLQYSLKNSREYPKTSGAIPRGLRPLGIAPSVFGYSLSFFREYFAIRLAKLHILLQYLL